MSAWVLILSLYGGGRYAAVAHVPGFTSESACMAAANAWLKQVDYAYSKALCVKT